MSSVTDSNAQDRVSLILETISDAANRAQVRRYLDERKASGVKGTTLANDANILRDLARFFAERPLASATREDIARFVNETERERIWRNRSKNGEETITRRRVTLNATTLAIRKVILKTFYKWLVPQQDPNAFPPVVAWLKASKPNGDFIPTDALLTPDEIQALLRAHPDRQERALLAVLYESGFRAGEFCALNVGSLELDQYGAVLTLPKKATGLKTGARRVRLLKTNPDPKNPELLESGSAGYLAAWKEAHPHKGDPKAPLFYTNSHRAPLARFTPNSLYVFVRRAALKAGIKKDVHPHLFRHTAATERAREGWTEYEMRAFFGWTRQSTMPSYYVHLAGKDYEDRLLERKGLKAPGESQRGGLAMKACRVCKTPNLWDAWFCAGCHSPISPKAEAEIERKREEVINENIARIVLEKNEELAEIVAARVLKKLGTRSPKPLAP